MPFCYILHSQKLTKYYVGACTNLERRLRQHNTGHSTFTRAGMLWEVKYSEEFETLKEAKSREIQIKKMKSRKYIESLLP